MQWPWVSREAYEERGRRLGELTDVVQMKEARIIDLAKQLAQAAAETNRLQTELSARTKPTATGTVAAEPDHLLMLAGQRAGRDASLRRQLIQYVLGERGKGTDDETIADRLTNWTDPEPDE